MLHIAKVGSILSPNLSNVEEKQGWIHGNPVADGWAGAIMRKLLAIQKCDRRTDVPTDTARCRVACPRLKKRKYRRRVNTRCEPPKTLAPPLTDQIAVINRLLIIAENFTNSATKAILQFSIKI